jgi:hypothetical protein
MGAVVQAVVGVINITDCQPMTLQATDFASGTNHVYRCYIDKAAPGRRSIIGNSVKERNEQSVYG